MHMNEKKDIEFMRNTVFFVCVKFCFLFRAWGWNKNFVISGVSKKFAYTTFSVISAQIIAP